jgi:hypothetical protein
MAGQTMILAATSTDVAATEILVVNDHSRPQCTNTNWNEPQGD